MKSTTTWLLIGALIGTAGCQDPETTARLNDLEGRVVDAEKRLAEVEKGGAPARPAVNEAEEKAASELLREATKLSDAMEYDEAKAKIGEIEAKYGKTRVARSSRRLKSELEIIGRDAGSLDAEKWFVGQTDLNQGEATLVVFWEVWCPHCQREVPDMQATYDKYNSKGLNMVGVTRVTKSATDEKVAEFISEHAVTYPMAKEKGDFSQRFGVRGIPAAAVVKDGKIVWRGHPAKINERMIQDWIGA